MLGKRLMKNDGFAVPLNVISFYLYCRVIFSSNFPVDKINGSFPELINSLRSVLEPFTQDEQEKFFSRNAKKFYRL